MALMPGFNELILIQMMAVVAELKHGRGWSLNLRLREREHLFDGGLVLAVKLVHTFLAAE